MGWFVSEIESIDSTNRYLIDLVNTKSVKPKTVILAHNQTAGRGQYGRSWSSIQGNLFASLFIEEIIQQDNIPLMGLIMAVAIKRSIDELNPKLPVQLKWPNDLLVEEAKLGGILTEVADYNNYTGIARLVVGFSLNMKSVPECDRAVVCLENIGILISPSRILALILKNLDNCIATWKNQGAKPILIEWLSASVFLGKEISIDGIKGIFVGLGENGRAILLTKDGLIDISRGTRL